MSDPLPVVVSCDVINDETVHITTWLVSSGEWVEQGQLVVEADTSKAALEVEAPKQGYIWPCCGNEEDVPVGSPLFFLTETPDPPPGNVPATDDQSSFNPRPPAIAVSGDLVGEPVRPHAYVSATLPEGLDAGQDVEIRAVRFSPLAARLARELGVSESDFSPGTLVRSQDVRALTETSSQCEAKPSPVLKGVPLRWERLPKRKFAEGRLLDEGRSASVSCSIALDFPFAEFRAKIQRSGGSPSAALIIEVARLLKKYPVFNAVYHDGEVGFYEEINIGWAIDDGAGLVVPVVAGADLKTLDEIDLELQGYFAAYVRNRLSPHDLRNPTFNISDLSGEGVSHFVPLIRRGQGAILGVGADSFTLSFDHQIAEGRTAANFLRDLIAGLSSFERDIAGDGHGAAADRSVPCCVGCQKDAAELQAANVFLLRYESAKPGYICSLCLNGY